MGPVMDPSIMSKTDGQILIWTLTHLRVLIKIKLILMYSGKGWGICWCIMGGCEPTSPHLHHIFPKWQMLWLAAIVVWYSVGPNPQGSHAYENWVGTMGYHILLCLPLCYFIWEGALACLVACLQLEAHKWGLMALCVLQGK